MCNDSDKVMRTSMTDLDLSIGKSAPISSQRIDLESTGLLEDERRHTRQIQEHTSTKSGQSPGLVYTGGMEWAWIG